MNLNEMITRYNKAIENDKVLEGKYQVIEKQMNHLLAELGMTYDEALKREKELRKYLSESMPKIEKYIAKVEEKRQVAEEQLA